MPILPSHTAMRSFTCPFPACLPPPSPPPPPLPEGTSSGDVGRAGSSPYDPHHSVLLLGVATDGKLWQWQMPLLWGALEGPKAPLPRMPRADLLGEAGGWGGRGAGCAGGYWPELGARARSRLGKEHVCWKNRHRQQATGIAGACMQWKINQNFVTH
jgi:hypothetical protein